jgi:hypothetical protein
MIKSFFNLLVSVSFVLVLLGGGVASADFCSFMLGGFDASECHGDDDCKANPMGGHCRWNGTCHVCMS